MDKKVERILREEDLPLTRDGVLLLLKRHELHSMTGVPALEDELVRVVMGPIDPSNCPRSCLEDLRVVVGAFPHLAKDEEVVEWMSIAMEELS